jgi:apolipoprotein N-acyltransferase
MTPWTPFIQPAAIGGVYLVSAWLVLVNLLVYRVFVSSNSARWSHFSDIRSLRLRSRLTWAIGLAVSFALPLLFGLLYIRPLQPWFRVAIVQPDVSPFDKGDWRARERIKADLVRLTASSAGTRPDLVLFPETATLVDVVHSKPTRALLQGLADSLHAGLFTGTPLYDVGRKSWHNGAVLLRPGQDSIWPRYYKMRLVPFSEKIPFVDEVPLIRRLIGTADMGDWDRGHEYTVFDAGFGRLSGLICFEAIFPDYAREFTRRGSDLFAVITNDGWFGRLPGAHQHAEMAVMRTVENGVPMVRSANNGISFIVDPYGRVLSHTRLFTQTVLTGQVPGPVAPTPYRRWGNWFIAACLAGVLALAGKKIAAGIAGRRRSPA